jgi:hypothetical protein
MGHARQDAGARHRHRLGGLAWLLPSIAVFSFASSAALCEEQNAPGSLHAQIETRQRYLSIEADGSVRPTAPGTGLIARIRQGVATALRKPVTAAKDGSLHLEILVPGRLLPGEYALEVCSVASGEPVEARAIFRFGSAADAAVSRERLRSWLLKTRAGFREVASLLEREGCLRRAQLGAGGTGRPGRAVEEAQRTAWTSALDRARSLMRRTRMDFGDYQREVLLTPFPEASAALSALVPAIAARRDELQSVLDAAARGEPTTLARPSRVLELARASARGLGAADEGPESDLWAWEPGLLGEPESASDPTRSSLGFSFARPSGWTVVDLRASGTDDALTRVRLTGPEAAQAVFRIRDYPETRSWDELVRKLPPQAIEEWGASAYDPVAETLLPGGPGHRVDAVLRRDPAQRLVVVSRGFPHGRRVVQLYVAVPVAAWESEKATIEALVSSFSLNVDAPPETGARRP